MARIPEAELERLKRDVSVERLALGRGIELKRHGADLIGRCPFHDDRTPSLVITPAKNLWHCLGACNAGGGPVDWVMRAEGASFRRAVELLRSGYAPSRITGPPPKRGTTAKLESPLSAGDAGALLGEVAGYYHQTLRQSPEALGYLEKRGLRNEALIETFKLGFANRTLGYRLPDANRKEGAEIRGRLQRLGILRESGHEHFNGSVVIPIANLQGEVTGMYGRKITANLRAGTPDHLYLAGPRRGVWNEAGIAEANGEVILCEALLDAMTFWCAGFRNVTASYGVNGFTDDHREAFRKRGIRRVYLAYDRDAAGDAAAAALAEELRASGIECLRAAFPRGMDANEYALKVTPAAKSLGLLLARAEWLAGGAISNKRQAISELPAAEASESSPGGIAAAAEESPKDKVAQEREPGPEEIFPLAAERLQAGGPEEWIWQAGGRKWRIRGLGKGTAAEQLKTNLMLTAGGGLHIDTLDLYAARQRQAFIKQAEEETGIEEDVVKHDLGKLLRLIEDLRAELAKPLAEAERPAMPEAARAEAIALLRDPNLVQRILADFAKCGVVGEETNLLAAYLASTSRLLDRPLAVVVQSSSAAGKSLLLDPVLAFMPEEETVRYSAMTGQALYYMGEADLKHKILAIAEEEGASRASYALKLLQSEGSLRIAATGKDPESGRLVTHEYRVEGPAAILLTTTAPDLDDELLNRCLVLGVDEERQQTRAIHREQREQETLAGLVRTAERRELAALHQNAQRLLERIPVVNEHARSLEFPDARLRSRRDHAKYLALIRAIALLHQHQRPRKQAGGISYIEATAEDVALADRIAGEVLVRSLDEVPEQTRRLLALLEQMVREGAVREAVERSEYRFTRRRAREYTGWAQTRMQLHLRRLEELEYILAHRGRRGESYVYELAYDADLSGETAQLSWPNHHHIGPCQGDFHAASDRMDTDPFSLLAAKEENRTIQETRENPVVTAAAGVGKAALAAGNQ